MTGSISGSLAAAIKAIEDSLARRKHWLLSALRTHIWQDPSAIDVGSCERLHALIERLAGEVQAFERASDEQARKLLAGEAAELEARFRLSQRKDAVVAFVGRLKSRAALERCREDLKTRRISDKVSELSGRAVTEELRQALENEFARLGVAGVKTRLSTRAERGKTIHKLLLDVPVSKPLEEILSEGEQREIAIGSFLAELQLANHAGGIVFDDPVSSLDHHRRRSVAIRLVEEAKKRQVIIFTHDTVFLGELREAIRKHGVDHKIAHLEWANERPGVVLQGLPWEHQSYKERLDHLAKGQQALAKSWTTYPNRAQRQQMVGLYDQLREAVECVVEQVALGNVVTRYSDWIHIGQLERVAGLTETECKQLQQLHNTCSSVGAGHDHASCKNASVPDVTQLGKDIQTLKETAETIARRWTNRSGAVGSRNNAG